MKPFGSFSTALLIGILLLTNETGAQKSTPTTHTIFMTLRRWELPEDKGQFPWAGNKSLETDHPGEKEPTQEILFRRC
jgi:hypothetical protein